jgi:beta-phosphoglucomutase-like phosphatase (HAD superfamily)
VVFEDSFAGIEAGKAGGMRVVAVATTHPLEELGQADRAVCTLAEVSVAELAAWF